MQTHHCSRCGRKRQKGQIPEDFHHHGSTLTGQNYYQSVGLGPIYTPQSFLTRLIKRVLTRYAGFIRVDDTLPCTIQCKYSQICKQQSLSTTNTVIVNYYNCNNTCTNRFGHRRANSCKNPPSTKSNWELPEISQHDTTSLTWPFNDAYKSHWGERWVKIPQNEKTNTISPAKANTTCQSV